MDQVQNRVQIIMMYLEDNLLYDDKIFQSLATCKTNKDLDMVLSELHECWKFDVEELAIAHYWIAAYVGLIDPF